jgi:hypothetical protein
MSMNDIELPHVAIYNDPTSGEQDAGVQTMVAALQQQIVNDFGPAWHTGAHVDFVASANKPPADAWVVAVLNNSDQAGALGYHDLTPAGLPLGKVFAGTDRQYNQKVSVTLSHELLEMLGDPWINLTAQSDDGKFYAWEACDAVEADELGYDINGVIVSDFVTPHWFGHGAGPVDFKGHLANPFQLATGGYISVFDPASGQGWQQVNAQEAADLEAALLIHSRPRIGSRRERRFVGRANWVRSTYETA